MKKLIFNIISANRPKFLNRPILDDSKKLILRSKVSYFSACTLCKNVNGVRKHNRPTKFPYLGHFRIKNPFQTLTRIKKFWELIFKKRLRVQLTSYTKKMFNVLRFRKMFTFLF